jgi:hypothetical protein
MSESEEQQSNEALEESLEEASRGRADAIEAFFAALLAGPLYIPRRYQTYPMSDSPQYPNDFVDVLGIQDDDRVVVPAFSSPAGIESWCGNMLAFRSLNGKEAAEATPEEWWLVINPGSDVEKELSPWEITRLKDGEAALPELLAEALADREVNPMHVRPCKEGEFSELLTALKAYVEGDERILSVYTLVEEPEAATAESISTLLMGVVVKSDVPGGDFASVQDEIEAPIAPYLIGGQSKKIFLGYDVTSSVMLGVFKGNVPFFTREKKKGLSFLKKLFS